MLKFLNFKNIFILLVSCLLLITGLIYFSNKHVIKISKNKNTDKIDEIEPKNVGLLLGTGKFLANGNTNPYYYYRIEAAIELFNAGKIKHIIISGDNSRADYDEPELMRQDLIKNGIPDSCLSLDYAGFRTLDSIIRCKEIYNQEDFIIISQKFHNERALFIAEKKHLKAIAYNAKSPEMAHRRYNRFREYLARVNAVLDIYIFNTSPKFLGEKVNLGFKVEPKIN